MVNADLDIANMVDIGCGDGSRAVCWSEALGIPKDHIAGCDAYQPYVDAGSNHFECMRVNIEWQPLPFETESADLVVCNQVLEHVKNFYFALDEIYRVAKTGKYVLISVPNLGSLHNRLLLAFGRQPTCIRYLRATEHIRGFTCDEFTEIVTVTSSFEVVAARGVDSIRSFPRSQVSCPGLEERECLHHSLAQEACWRWFLPRLCELGNAFVLPLSLTPSDRRVLHMPLCA